MFARGNCTPKHTIAGGFSWACFLFLWRFHFEFDSRLFWQLFHDILTVPLSLIFHVLKWNPVLFLRTSEIGFFPPPPLVWQAKVKSRRTKILHVQGKNPVRPFSLPPFTQRLSRKKPNPEAAICGRNEGRHRSFEPCQHLRGVGQCWANCWCKWHQRLAWDQ